MQLPLIKTESIWMGENARFEIGHFLVLAISIRMVCLCAYGAYGAI